MKSLLLSLAFGAAAQVTVVPVALSVPDYPAIAQSVRVQGDEEIVVHVRPDGGVESMTVIRNREPLVLPAALDAARSSQFIPTIERRPRSGTCLWLWRCGLRHVYQ